MELTRGQAHNQEWCKRTGENIDIVMPGTPLAKSAKHTPHLLNIGQKTWPKLELPELTPCSFEFAFYSKDTYGTS